MKRERNGTEENKRRMKAKRRERIEKRRRDKREEKRFEQIVGILGEHLVSVEIEFTRS